MSFQTKSLQAESLQAKSLQGESLQTTLSQSSPLEAAASTWRVQLEIVFSAPESLDLGAWIPALHHIIQQQDLDETWIDVVDYRHVGDGPALLLVSHEAYYGIEHNPRRSALLYRRRRPSTGTLEECLLDGGRRLLAFARRLSTEALSQDVTWRTDEWTVTLADRLLAPAQAATSEALLEPVQSLQRRLWGKAAVHRHQVTADNEPLTFSLSSDLEQDLAHQWQRLTSTVAEGQDATPWVATPPAASALAGVPS